MADPVVIDCPAACTVTVQHEITLPVLNLSPAEGAAIAGAVLAVWAVGWAFRMLIRALNIDGNSSTSKEET